ncbi:MAG: hypothetical protein HY681_13725 [Chloroflexi bacterium]|nr:hypothetical protein [Chloroflexota bacterium]
MAKNKQRPKPNPTKQPNEEVLSPFTIEATFSPYVWLEILLDPSTIKTLESEEVSSKNQSKSGLRFEGYKFLVAAFLYDFVEHVIACPSVIDLPYDPGLADAWQRQQTRGRDTLAQLVRKDSSISLVLNQVLQFWSDLLPLRSWSDFALTRIRIAEYAQAIRRGVRFAYTANEGQDIKRQRVESALGNLALDYLWPTFGIAGELSGFYSDIYMRSVTAMRNNVRPEELDFESGEPTTRYDRPDELHLPNRPPELWATGYARSLRICIDRLATKDTDPAVRNVLRLLEEVQSWRQLSAIAHEVPLSPTANKHPLRKRRQFPRTCLRQIMLHSEVEPDGERLLASLGSPLKIVENDSLSAPRNFEVLLRGAVQIAQEHSDKVKVARFIHSENFGPKAYSLGIFMPLYTGISNWSSWWVFYDLYSEDFESRVQRQIVEKAIADSEDCLTLVEYFINKEALLSVAEDPGFLYLKEELRVAKDVNWSLRGSLPELTAAAMLASMGYSPVKIGLKPKFLGKELDVSGVKTDQVKSQEFWVLECKGEATSTDADLAKVLEEFSKKIRVIRSNRKQFATTLGLTVVPRKVRGTCISMSDLSYVTVRVPRGIELWSFDDFTTALKKARVPDEHFRLLKRSSVAQLVTFNPASFESIFGGGTQ